MSKVTLEQLESILEDIVPDEESAEAFGVSYTTIDQNRRLKISCVKIQDDEEVIFIGIAERVWQDVLFLSILAKESSVYEESLFGAAIYSWQQDLR